MALQTKTVSTGDYAWRSWSNGYVITLSLTEESVDYVTNTSVVSYLFTISNTDNNRFYANDYSWSISIGGQSIPVSHFYFNLSSNFTTQTIASGMLTVKHNADGTLEMPYSVSIPNVQADNRYGPPAMALSGNWGLTRISRTLSVCCPDCTIGERVEITVGGEEAGQTYTITYSFGSLSGVIRERTQETEFLWTVPEEFYGQLPDGKTGVCVISGTAYNGNTAAGSGKCEIRISIDESAGTPALSGNIVDINEATIALTGNAEQLVRYCSNARVTAVCRAKEGATITSCTVTNNGTVYTELPVTVYGVEKGDFRFYAADSRGYTTSVTIAKTVIPYIRLTCSLSDNKPDGDGNMTVKVSGNYFNGSFGAQNNTLTVEYRYKESGGSYGEWIPMEVTPGVRTYNAEAELTGLDYKAAYVFQARAADKLAVANSAEYAVRATPVFDWDENDFNVNGTFKINNEPVEDFLVSRGNSGIWVWEKWNSGVCRCWGKSGEKKMTFLGEGPLYYSDTVHSFSYPFALTQVDSISADIVTGEGYVVPVILSVNDTVRTSFVRFYGGSDPITGYYTFSVVGRWK